MAKVFVSTVPRKTATKISEVVNGKTNVRLNQTKITRGCRDTFAILPSASRGGALNTGLNKYVDNPYKDGTGLPAGFEALKGADTVREQHLVEIKFNKPYGYFTDEPYNRNNFDKDKAPTFYQTFKFSMNDGVTILDTENMNDYLAYRAMLVSKKFAPSRKDLEAGKYPDAMYYISLENETEDIKYRKVQRLNSATAKLADSDFDPETQKKMIKVLGIAKGILTNQQAYNLLDSYIKDATPGKDNITEFEKMYNLLTTADGREEFEARYLLQDLQDAWIVSEYQGTYTWGAKKMVLGQRKDDAVKFLMNPEKQDEVKELKKQLVAKRSI